MCLVFREVEIYVCDMHQMLLVDRDSMDIFFEKFVCFI